VNVKLPIYARTGIPEVWIENLAEDVLLICRNPVGNRYTTELKLHRGETATPLAFPGVDFPVEQLLGRLSIEDSLPFTFL
jgi:hypothetical protein